MTDESQGKRRVQKIDSGGDTEAVFSAGQEIPMDDDLRIRKRRVLVYWEKELENARRNVKKIENTIEAVRKAEALEELAIAQPRTVDDFFDTLDPSRLVREQIRLLVVCDPEVPFDEVINVVSYSPMLGGMTPEEVINKFPHAREDYLKAKEEFSVEE
jgi:hypothetical protein